MANAIFAGLILIVACLPGCPGFKYLPEQAQGEMFLLGADDNNDGDLSTDEICGSSMIKAELAEYDWKECDAYRAASEQQYPRRGDMSKGKLAKDYLWQETFTDKDGGKWAAGFHFNQELCRLHVLIRIRTDGYHQNKCEVVGYTN